MKHTLFNWITGWRSRRRARIARLRLMRTRHLHPYPSPTLRKQLRKEARS